MRTRIEIIYWDDAAGGKGPIEPADIKTHFPTITVGQYVKEDGRSITVAMETFDVPDDNRVRDYAVIPKAIILTRKTTWATVAASQSKGRRRKKR